jgi:hypothetical protein
MTRFLSSRRVVHSLLLAGLFVGPLWVLAQGEERLPVATTVAVEGADVVPGAVVRYDELAATYSLSATSSDPAVFGVVANQPAIVFVTATSAVPVITNGVTVVRVSDVNGIAVRGDLLTTTITPGVAAVAATSTERAFAIALAPADPATGLVTAELNQTKAQVALEARQAAAAAETTTLSREPTLVRMAIAVIMLVGALAFLLYSFRSILHSGVLSIGRNPRARLSVVYVSIGSMAMVIVVAAVVVLIALGVLVVPL